MRNKDTLNATVYRVFLFTTFFWIAGWMVKAIFFKPYLFSFIETYPIHHPLFPAWFKNSLVAQIAYTLPLLAVILIFSRRKIFCILSSGIFIVASLTLLWHNDTYNDATFVTSFWTALWLLWLSFNMDSQRKDLGLHAKVLAQAIVGMTFFGGFVGKLTPAYFNGDAIFYIFFAERTYWPFSWLVNFPIDQQREIARILSLSIVAMEGFIALGPLVPFRFYAIVVPVLLLGFVIMNTWMILSVVLSLVGLLWACWYWSFQENKASYA